MTYTYLLSGKTVNQKIYTALERGRNSSLGSMQREKNPITGSLKDLIPPNTVSNG